MFSGIVEETGRIVDLREFPQAWRLTVETRQIAESVRFGDSVAHNGCCLTVTRIKDSMLSYDLLDETLKKTNLGDLSPGMLVNLERSLKADGRIDGHFVSGHVDCTGTITRWEKSGKNHILEVEVPDGNERYLVPKGCIAIDGMSLTVGEVSGSRFHVWIIPHTYELTSLKERKTGDRVNLEFDLLAKYTEKLMAQK